MFELGSVVATPCAIRVCSLSNINPLILIGRHRSGDWGELGEEDLQANRDALAFDGRVFSSYVVGDTKLYVITEWDRSYTTMMCASDY